jgi:hypothetical protein
MEKRTQILIDRLLDLTSRDEIDQIIGDSYSNIKQSLMDQGYLFQEDKVFHDLKEEQAFSNHQEIADSQYYEEINFIKNGLQFGWSSNLTDFERFKFIQDSIDEIIVQFDQ